MTSSCPYCFRPVPSDRVVFRCTSGMCSATRNEQATEMAGFEINLTSCYADQVSDSHSSLAASMPCMDCQQPCTQEVCPQCLRDLPPNWRHADVFTMAVTGARGAGKSVYIAVLVQWLRRMAELTSRNVSPQTTGTADVFNAYYHEPMFGENKVIGGTPPVALDGSYQRDPLIWKVSSGGGRGEFFIVMKDMAGEDLERALSPQPQFSYCDFADLTVFLFDPFMLPEMLQVLEGMIPSVDRRRLGMGASEALANLLTQFRTPAGRLALTVSKFDAVQQLPSGDNSYAPVLANPAAHFNTDPTFLRDASTAGERAVSSKDFQAESAFLDAEVRSLLALFGEQSVSAQADEAVAGDRLLDIRHFAVSSLGETPRHTNQLTVRGVSPFRVLDPLLWGLESTGKWI